MNKEDYIGQLIDNERLQLRDKFDQQKTESFNNLIIEKDKEIERLNNILNKIEKESYLGRKENEDKGNDYQNGLTAAYNYIYNKIQELQNK